MAAKNVKKEDIKALREKTGAGIVDCKKALLEFNGDIEKAADALRARGLVKAVKRMDRSTSNGRIVAYIHGTGNIGVILQLNCETDFVARTEEFEQLGKDICMQIAAMNPTCLKVDDLEKEVLEREKTIYAEQLKRDGKKKEQIEKIIPGKIKKFFREVCLLEQPFIKENKKTITEYLQEHIAKFGENITISKYTRYQMR